MKAEFKYPIGTKFIPRCQSKFKTVYTVIDHLTTTNSSGEVVERVYLCEHSFLGEIVRCKEVETTIAMGLAEFGEVA
jgi:hypothetical protein